MATIKTINNNLITTSSGVTDLEKDLKKYVDFKYSFIKRQIKRNQWKGGIKRR